MFLVSTTSVSPSKWPRASPMYVRMFDDLERSETDNPTIGIILCTSKDATIVKYSVLKDNEQLFATKYRSCLPSEQELVAEIERNKHFLEEKLKSQTTDNASATTK